MSDNDIPMVTLTFSVGITCKICGTHIPFDEHDTARMKHGLPIDKFPICDECLGFLRELKKERASNGRH